MTDRTEVAPARWSARLAPLGAPDASGHVLAEISPGEPVPTSAPLPLPLYVRRQGEDGVQLLRAGEITELGQRDGWLVAAGTLDDSYEGRVLRETLTEWDSGLGIAVAVSGLADCGQRAGEPPASLDGWKVVAALVSERSMFQDARIALLPELSDAP